MIKLQLRNRGGDSHEIDIMPCLVSRDNRIQAIFCLISPELQSLFKSHSEWPRISLEIRRSKIWR